MNRAKLTPCRKVGLSRKKNTPNRTVESLLTESSISQITPDSIKQEKKNATSCKSSQLTELNCDTPCRQVGLSRKRKTLTPLSDIKSNMSVSTTLSPSSLLDNESLEKNTLINVINKKDKTQNGRGIRLTEKFSYTSDVCQKNPLEISDGIDENSISKTKVSNLSTRKSNIEEFVEYDERIQVILDEAKDSKEKLLYKEHIGHGGDPEFNIKGENTFIKVCYESKKDNSELNTKIKNSTVPIKPKFNRKIFVDEEDDFVVSEKRIKSKNIFGRYETDVASLQKKVSKKESIPLKKSISLNGRNTTTLTGTDSEISIADCYVKLIHLENKPKKSCIISKTQELSDDDFELLTSTPPNMKNKINNLEKQVKEKRIILEELERAKMYKKMHNIDELKTLTSKWEIGCKLALEDLLERLNTHREMNMNMLLKKLNIPDDFMLSSQ
ncbi:hypothetical protein WA026_007103 [Henosepilachna vigintioctopunctata]|uniref:Meiosis protein 5 homolog n=1 Tax=Henosepilachna vigintioctopunctata TaxID=420089 RepID=A0AAW1V213_9CUCU